MGIEVGLRLGWGSVTVTGFSSDVRSVLVRDSLLIELSFGVRRMCVGLSLGRCLVLCWIGCLIVVGSLLYLNGLVLDRCWLFVGSVVGCIPGLLLDRRFMLVGLLLGCRWSAVGSMLDGFFVIFLIYFLTN